MNTNEKTLSNEVAAWTTNINKKCNGVDWQFTTADARVKLKHLYPVTKES